MQELLSPNKIPYLVILAAGVLLYFTKVNDSNDEGAARSDSGAEEEQLDTAKLKQKYDEERKKRLRSDGVKQFRTVKEDVLSGFFDDPHADSNFSRDPITKDVTVLIVGGGFGAQQAARQLQKQGIDDFLIVEKAAGWGGAWYWNRYPGLACDTESYIYLPMLEEVGYIPSQKYVTGKEIRSYAEKLARNFGLDDKVEFQTEIEVLEWNEGDSHWTVKTNRGDDIKARFVIAAGGSLHMPKFPSLQGIENFEGASFHTSRWDYEYTGGSMKGGLSKLKDKRVGIVGTGQ
jgi:cyclohexanone monooxygenase